MTHLIEMTGEGVVAVEAVVAIRTESVTCPVMIVGRNRRNHARVVGDGMKAEMIENQVVGGTTTEITDVMKMTGQFHCQKTIELNKNYLGQATPESISASTKIFLLKQPGIKSRVTLHLYDFFENNFFPY